MPQRFWHIKNCSLFQLLTSEQLGGLERLARLRSFPRGSAVYTPADGAEGVFLLGEGRIRLCSHTADGKQAILGFVEPGEVFGELALLHDGDREERAEAAADSTVVLLPADAVRRLMEDSAPLAIGVTKLIGLRRRRLERRLRSLLFRSNRERLGHLLWDLAEQYGEETPEGLLLKIKLSHQDLASLIGATRETVTVTLGEMQLAGLLRVSRQRLVLRNLPALAEELGLPPPAKSAPSPSPLARPVRRVDTAPG